VGFGEASIRLSLVVAGYRKKGLDIMEAHHSWREFWHHLQHQLQVGLSWMISSLVETLYLVIWVLMQWSFERLLAWLPVSPDSRWELVVLRAIFALSTFIMIMLSMYADVRRAWYEARNLITEPHIPPDTERTQSDGDKLRPLAPPSARFRRTLITAIYWALLVGLIVGGAGFVGVVTKTTWGVASYLVTLAIATYLDKTSKLLCRILSEKVEKWGLEIVNVKLFELGMPESAKGT
jgi:hypothetical protein